MTMPLIPPFAITGAYQNSQMADGVYFAGGSQVFSHLVSPPDSGLQGEEWSDDAGKNAAYVAGTSVSEVQTISTSGTPTGGSIGKLEFDSVKTAALVAYNAAAATVQSALEGLSTVGTGNVVCAGGPLPTAITCTFAGTLAGKAVPTIRVRETAFTGGTNPAVSVAVTTPGSKKVSTGTKNAVGAPITAANNPAVKATYEQRDSMRDTYDSASGNHF